MPATTNLQIYKGEAVTLPFKQVIAGTTTGEDITGRTYVLTVRNRAGDTATVLTKTATITSPTTGDYQFALTHAETVALAAGPYAYDIQRTDAGSETVVSIGAFEVLQEVLYP